MPKTVRCGHKRCIAPATSVIYWGTGEGEYAFACPNHVDELFDSLGGEICIPIPGHES